MLITPLAISTSLWFLIAILLIVVAVVLTNYTRRGSGIDQHPVGSETDAPGAEGSSEVGPAQDADESPDFGDRGTR